MVFLSFFNDYKLRSKRDTGALKKGQTAFKRGQQNQKTDMIDELLILKNSNGVKYKQSLNKFGKIQFLILDDFLITHLNEERSSILFQLIKLKETNGTSTIVTCQYPATDWGDFMGAQNEPALSDAIRRRLTSGFILNIESA